MTDGQKIYMQRGEMVELADGAVQPFATQEEKDEEMHRRDLLLNALKPLMGL